MNVFEFAVLSGLRVAQLTRGCIPRVVVPSLKVTVTAQREVAEGLVVRSGPLAETAVIHE
jgi:DNA-directed RNA polymerase subunit K/omega